METAFDNGPGAGSAATAADKNAESGIITRVLNKIINKWWLFLLVGLAGGVGGFMYAANQKPVYSSHLSFALDEGGAEGGMSAAAGFAAQFGISLGGAKDVFTGDNILEIMLSRRVIERVLLSVDTFDNKPYTLIEFYLQNQISKAKKEAADSVVHFYPGDSKTSFSYAKQTALYNTFSAFKTEHISAKRPNKRLNIYELAVTTGNEKLSKVFTDKLIEETNRFYTEISSKKARETLELLEKRVPDMKGKLDATIASKAAIQDANVNTAFASAQVPLLKQQSNTQVYGTAYAEMFKNLEMARFQYLKSIPLMQVIDAADYPMTKTKVGKLKTAVIFSIVAAFIFLLIFIAVNILIDRKQMSRR